MLSKTFVVVVVVVVVHISILNKVVYYEQTVQHTLSLNNLSILQDYITTQLYHYHTVFFAGVSDAESK